MCVCFVLRTVFVNKPLISSKMQKLCSISECCEQAMIFILRIINVFRYYSWSSFNMMMRAVCELVFRRRHIQLQLAATSLASKGKVCVCFLRWCYISLECLKVSHAPIIIRGYDIYGQRNFSIKLQPPTKICETN